MAAIARADARELILESREAEAAALAAGARNVTEAHPLVKACRAQLTATHNVVGPLNAFAHQCANNANAMHAALRAYQNPTQVWPNVVVGEWAPQITQHYLTGYGGITYLSNDTHTIVLQNGTVIAQACFLPSQCD